MSLEDDTDNGEVELRELVTQTLEENGVLSKIRAQLRAGLYLALENDINITDNQDFYNSSLKTKLKNPDIRIIFCLVREFLEYFELGFTCSVFEKETFMGSSFMYENREKLVQELDIGIDALHNSPLLLEILNIARSSFNISMRDLHNDVNFNSTRNADVSKNVNNATYEVPSREKSVYADNVSLKNSFSESAPTEVSLPVIGLKTVPKENIQDSERSESNHVQNGNTEHGSSNSEKDKSESVNGDVNTHQSEIVTPKKVSLSKNNDDDKAEPDDTYEGTSSIAEDSIVSNNKEQSMLIDFDKTLKLPLSITNSPLSANGKNLIDQTIDDSPKSPKLSFSPEQNQRKHDKSERLEKLKPMSGLTSLSDLPPLQLNKSRNSDTVLLPSLYSKDFREKSSLKDIDKLLDVNFDSLDNYEEDFMSSGSIENDDVELNNIFISAQSPSIKLKKVKPEELSNRQKSTKNERSLKTVHKDINNSEQKQLNDLIKQTDKVEQNPNGNEHEIENNLNKESGTSSISEDFDINSNVDDLLKSSSTT